MRAKIGQYIVWEKESKSGHHGGGIICYSKGSINKVLDYDARENRLYFGPTSSMDVGFSNGRYKAFDSETAALSYQKSLIQKPEIQSGDRPTSSSKYQSWNLSDPPVSSSPTYDKYREGSPVTFTLSGEEYGYSVTSTGLRSDDSDDDIILYNLDIVSQTAQLHFCSVAYGYTPTSNLIDGFPAFRSGDFQAAERVIDAIKLKCREVEKETLLEEVAQAEKELLISKLKHTQAQHTSRFNYTPTYEIRSTVTFLINQKELVYDVNTHYMTCRYGWDAIYKELGVNPQSFIAEATGKPAVYHHGGGAYGIIASDMVSSDKLINALFKACEAHRSKNSYTMALQQSMTNTQVRNTNSAKSSALDGLLDGLEVKELTIH